MALPADPVLLEHCRNCPSCGNYVTIHYNCIIYFSKTRITFGHTFFRQNNKNNNREEQLMRRNDAKIIHA